HYEDSPAKPSAFGLWIGGRYAEFPELWAQASPLGYAGASTPPTLFVNSARPRFRAGRDAYMEKLAAAGVETRAVEIADTPHTFWLFECWLDSASDEIARFLDAAMPPAD